MTQLTNENEGNRDDEGEDIAADGLVVLAVPLGEEMQRCVDVVLAQCLVENTASVTTR